MMKAILVIPEQQVIPCPTVPCLPLFPLMDRPFLQHVVEALAGRGVTDIQIVFGQGADAVERFLGDGTRWGCSFSYHLIGDPERPACVLRAAAADGGLVLIARADRLPVLPTSFSGSGPGMLFGTPGDWSGWAVADARELRAAPAVSPAELAHYLAGRGATWVSAGRPLVLQSLADVPAAQQAFLRGEVPGALVAARETRPGVWTGPNVRVAPTARLVPPVFVGENTIVGAGVCLGPSVVVGPNCMLDRDCGARDTTVCAGTYVGPGVELDGVIVDGSSLVNPRNQTVATIDRRLLDHLVPVLPLTSWLWRLLAAAAFVAALPVVLAAALWLRLTRPGPVFWRRRFVRAPSSASEPPEEVGTVITLSPPRRGEDVYGWVIPATLRGLILELLPALWCVACGSLRLVGLPPRAGHLLRAQGTRCPALLRASPGLVTEVALCRPERLTPEDCLLVDAYQTQTSDSLANLKRVCRFLFGVLTVWGKADHGTILVGAEAARADPWSSAEPAGRLSGTAVEPVIEP